MEMVKDRCKMKNGLIVPSNGKSGVWKEGVIVEIQTYSPSHIDALVDAGMVALYKILWQS